MPVNIDAREQTSDVSICICRCSGVRVPDALIKISLEKSKYHVHRAFSTENISTVDSLRINFREKHLKAFIYIANAQRFIPCKTNKHTLTLPQASSRKIKHPAVENSPFFTCLLNRESDGALSDLKNSGPEMRRFGRMKAQVVNVQMGQPPRKTRRGERAWKSWFIHAELIALWEDGFFFPDFSLESEKMRLWAGKAYLLGPHFSTELYRKIFWIFVIFLRKREL